MKLVDLLSKETGATKDHIMLLRHSSESITALLESGSTVEEYTAIQPVDTKYDYARLGWPSIEIVAVIVNDRVYAVFQVLGILAEGTNYSLGSVSYQEFDASRGKKVVAARKFDLQRIPSVAAGLPTTGWEGRQRTPVQRSDGSFFEEVDVPSIDVPRTLTAMREAFERAVDRSNRDSESARAERLRTAPAFPQRIAVFTSEFVRNPDVVAEVLRRAAGCCESCRGPAPFKRRSDGSPFLEVHHRLPLALGGEDTVRNAVALCPNCHRREHYG